uniref:Uncharacterized protein n=1 Tax=Rhizophora mucronata TaxID=61149 RepID=A0A2P2PE44_RHIMU
MRKLFYCDMLIMSLNGRTNLFIKVEVKICILYTFLKLRGNFVC